MHRMVSCLRGIRHELLETLGLFLEFDPYHVLYIITIFNCIAGSYNKMSLDIPSSNILSINCLNKAKRF